MKKFIFGHLCFFLIVINPGYSQTPVAMNLNTVPEVDIDRYMGVWYEIARFPHRFEKDLVGVTATYEKRSDGKISVLNQGYKYTLTGKHKKANGKARIPDSSQPGRLQVTFFLWFWADYLILKLDENYQYVLVGSSTPGYLWILSRTPQLDEGIYSELVNSAKEMGYDVSRLEKVLQK
jgi:apolipoprotein D and lipocalin family protein